MVDDIEPYMFWKELIVILWSDCVSQHIFLSISEPILLISDPLLSIFQGLFCLTILLHYMPALDGPATAVLLLARPREVVLTPGELMLTPTSSGVQEGAKGERVCVLNT